MIRIVIRNPLWGCELFLSKWIHSKKLPPHTKKAPLFTDVISNQVQASIPKYRGTPTILHCPFRALQFNSHNFALSIPCTSIQLPQFCTVHSVHFNSTPTILHCPFRALQFNFHNFALSIPCTSIQLPQFFTVHSVHFNSTPTILHCPFRALQLNSHNFALSIPCTAIQLPQFCTVHSVHFS